MNALEVRNVSRTYRAKRRANPVVALADLTLTVQPGEHLALLGPNGAGKSTLLKLITGLDTPDRGSITVLGTAPQHARARVGVIFQHPALDPLLTIRENLHLAAALTGLSGATDRLEETARTLGITDRLNDRVATLSGGLARRADLARALLTDPDLLLLDEPTSGLDPGARAHFLDALDQRRAAQPNLTILMSTHLMDEAERATRVALIAKGALVADGTPSELRACLGSDQLISVAAEHEHTLRDAGLTVTRRADRAIGTGQNNQLRAAAQSLLEHGHPFELAPPTLSDVYLALTGTDLSDQTTVPTGAHA